MMLTPGTQAPDFTLPDQHNTPWQLSRYIGKNEIVLYFYPKDNTPGCTAEACSFRDNMAAFGKLQALVVGISADTPAQHRQFIERYGLPFTLLSDTDNNVRQLYQVPKSLLGLLPGRTTYIINRQGIITHTFNHQLAARRHVSEALQALQELRQ